MKRRRRAGYSSFAGASLGLFTTEDLHQIHLATLEVLRDTGVLITDKRALDYFQDNGASVDRESKIVKIPSYMVEAAIASAPESVFLAGRDRKYDITLEDGRVHVCPFGVGIMMKDVNTGEIRETRTEDVADCARIVDYLEEYDFLFDTVVCRDAKPAIAGFINGFEASLNNTFKPTLVSPDDWATANYLVEMAVAVAGSHQALRERPFIMPASCTISPLTIPDSTLATIITAAENGLPSMTLTMAMSGGMAPVTLAGALIVSNAEILAALTLSQLVAPGSPFVYGSSTGTLDMRHNAAAMVGCPELGLISAGLVAVARMYNIPTLVAGL